MGRPAWARRISLATVVAVAGALLGAACGPPPTSIAVNDVQAREGDGVATFTFRMVATSGTVRVDYATGPGASPSAGAPDDYATTSGTLVFSPGETTRTVAVPLVLDGMDEYDERFTLQLSNPRGASLQRTSAEATIVDVDPAPTVSFVGPVSFTEGDTGTMTERGAFLVRLSKPSGKSVLATVESLPDGGPGKATGDVDYRSLNFTLAIPPGGTEARAPVSIQGDALDEDDEVFTVRLTGAGNAFLTSSPEVSGRILDDDAPPTVTVSDATVREGDVDLVFDVTLSAPSGRAISLGYATSDGSAVDGEDYEGVSGRLDFVPSGNGQTATTQTVRVPTFEDSCQEFTEDLLLDLSSPQNVSLLDAQGRGTITNDGDIVPCL